MSGEERLVTSKRAEEDTAELALRPQTLDDFIGQKQLRENLKIYVAAAKSRKEALDHVLFHGPPGLGKTTLAQIVAREMGVGFRATSGPVIQKAGDLAAQLTNLQPHDVLFIDEIHRLNPSIEEILYPAMEDFQLDLMIGEGPAARSVRIELPPFTLVGATTRSGLMTRPLLERFGIPLRMIFYEPAELELIVHRAARVLKMQMAKDGGAEIAKRSRGTPRVANRLLRRVRDFAAVGGHSVVDRSSLARGQPGHAFRPGVEPGPHDPDATSGQTAARLWRASSALILSTERSSVNAIHAWYSACSSRDRDSFRSASSWRRRSSSGGNL